jgi:hypothetical protein
MSDYPYLIRFVIILNILLFITFIVLSFVILVMRLRRDEAKKKLVEMDKLYYDMLLELVFEDDFNEKISTPEKVNDLRRLFLGKYAYTDISKNALVEVIAKLYVNLSGDAGQRLKDIYMQMELYKHSRKKLSSVEWDIKVQGIKEIALMGVIAYVDDVGKFINDSHSIVRREARLAFLQLDPKNLQTFIDKTTTHISYWEIINIIDVINSNMMEYLANFAPRFDSELSSLVYFCLKITNYYMLADYAQAISYLYMYPNTGVKLLAIQTIALFGNTKMKGTFKERYNEEPDSVKIEIIRAFKIFGDEEDISFLSSIVLNSSANNMRFEALKSINEIEKMDRSTLFRFKDKDPELSKMVRHILDERIL